MLDRRALIASGLAAAAPLPSARAAAPRDRFAAIEARLGGRVGVQAFDTGSGRRIARRADERFPMCSVFKWLLAANVLARVDAGREQLEREVRYRARDLVGYAPVTRGHVSEGRLSVAQLCAAAVTVSDNGAANLLLNSIGGPHALTRWLRRSGDPTTRCDRMEPALNSSIAGDPRDTTAPAAMVGDLQRIVLGEVLSPASRERLTGWLLANKTGDARLRAGFPKGWRVADKTGTSAEQAATSNDVAVVWPPGRKPILVAAFLTRGHADAKARDAGLAEIGRIVATEFGGGR
jgi:beta-lactamase class A